MTADQIEARLIQHPAICDCVVRSRKNTGQDRLFIYYTTARRISRAVIADHLAPVLSSSTSVPVHFAQIAAIPIDPYGNVDEAALHEIAIIDDEVVSNWEAQVRQAEGIQEAAVVLSDGPSPPQPLLLPSLTSYASAASNEEGPKQDSNIGGGQIGQPKKSVDQRPIAFLAGGPLDMPEGAPRTLVEALLQTARAHPDHGITYVYDNGLEEFQPYPSLLVHAKKTLAGLYANGIEPGDRVILQIESMDDHFAAFWACILGGITPVTVAIAPSYSEPNAVLNKLYSVWQLLEQPAIIGNESLTPSLAVFQQTFGIDALSILSVDRLKQHAPTESIHQSAPADIAFLQLTSGSTGVPKCIQIRHHGVISHAFAVHRFSGNASDDVTFNWLPFDHVGPMLMLHLTDVVIGNSQVHAKPIVVVSDALKWLALVEKYKVTHTWSPNFGYKLVCERLREAEHIRLDLSRVKFFMNAGEQVTELVVNEFLRLTVPFGLHHCTMQPAYGMAETCTYMTSANGFDEVRGVLRFLKSSMPGPLVPAAGADDVPTVSFVDVGSPIPGVQIRIRDSHNRVVREGTVGNLHVKGDVITPGYVANEAANREAFVGDGWFNTGDLAFIWNGRLVVTGREKEMILVRGANFSCAEIEDVIDSVAGVEPTFAAACSVANTLTGSEELAVFLVPKAKFRGQLETLLRDVRSEIASRVGINPSFVIPLEKHELPKTTSGKIQRTHLKNTLEAGGFLGRSLDEMPQSIPAWFYKSVWSRYNLRSLKRPARDGSTLILADHDGLSPALARMLIGRGERCIVVQAAREFDRIDKDTYRVDPADSSHYRRLLAALCAEDLPIRQVLHVWQYAAYAEEPSSPEMLDRSQITGPLSLIALTQALADFQETDRSIDLFVIGSYTQRVAEPDKIAYERSTTPGLLQCIVDEPGPWNSVRHIDLLPGIGAEQAPLLLAEIDAVSSDIEISYRDGKRWVRRIERMHRLEPCDGYGTFRHGGNYLITGGLGAIAVQVARFLLNTYAANLLLAGRSNISVDEEKRAAYKRLSFLDGTVEYAEVDVCDEEGLKSAVSRAESRWGSPLDGVLHLAGVFGEASLREQDPEAFLQILRTKLLGAWVLRKLLAPDRLFVAFSSAYSQFGALRTGAYTAANRALESFVLRAREHDKLNAYCYAWGHWQNIGMSRTDDPEMSDTMLQAGYMPISVEQGLISLLALLGGNQRDLIIGVDETHCRVRRSLLSDDLHWEELEAFYTLNADVQPDDPVFSAPIDLSSRPIPYVSQRIDEMPLTAAGVIDRDRLTRASQQPYVAPSSDLEVSIAQVFSKVLGIARVGVNDNFFELGGDSSTTMRAIMEFARLRINLPTYEFRQHATVAKIARHTAVAQAAGELQSELSKHDRAPSASRNDVWMADPSDILMPLSCLAFQKIGIWHKCSEKLTPSVFIRTVRELWVAQEGLRFAIDATSSGPRARIVPPEYGGYLAVFDLSEAPDSEAVAARIAGTLQSVVVSRGYPLVYFVYLRMDANRPSLTFYTSRHVTRDPYSLAILHQQLEDACEQLISGEELNIPKPATSITEWSARQNAYVKSEEAQREIQYWRSVKWPAVQFQPIDDDHPPVPGEDFGRAEARLGEDAAASLRRKCIRQGVGVNNALVGALVWCLWELERTSSTSFLLFGSGRDVADMDLTSTLGWIACAYPVVLGPGSAASVSSCIEAVNEQINAVPNNGRTFQWLLDHGKIGKYVSLETVSITVNMYPEMSTQAGVHLLADRGFPLRRPTHARSVNELVYKLDRLIPMTRHTVRLHFMDDCYGGPGLVRFAIDINDKRAEDDFDLNNTAGAKYRAVVRDYEAVSNSNGVITVALQSDHYVTCLCGIEVLGPCETSNRRINVGGPTYPPFEEDPYGFTWAGADGTTSCLDEVYTAGVPNAAPMAIYQSLRFTTNHPGELFVPGTRPVKGGMQFVIMHIEDGLLFKLRAIRPQEQIDRLSALFVERIKQYISA